MPSRRVTRLPGCGGGVAGVFYLMAAGREAACLSWLAGWMCAVFWVGVTRRTRLHWAEGRDWALDVCELLGK